MSRPIVILDTETTALGDAARMWEIALIRREPDGRERTFVGQIQYDLATLPPCTSPEALHVSGWLTRGAPGSTYLDSLGSDAPHWRWPSEAEAAPDIHRWFADEPVLVGVGIHFDAAVLSSMFLRHGRPEQPWHYAIVDLKTATWGYAQGGYRCSEAVAEEFRELPARSEALANWLGVEPPADDERHTALGDARWAARWFDALTGSAA